MKTGVTAVVAASWLLALSAEAATGMEIGESLPRAAGFRRQTTLAANGVRAR